MNTIEKRNRLVELQTEAKVLEEEIKRETARCKHTWTEVVSDPEEIRVPQFSHYEGHGSDPNPVYTYYTTTKARWRRTCTSCGLTEYTYSLKPAAYEPNFE